MSKDIEMPSPTTGLKNSKEDVEYAIVELKKNYKGYQDYKKKNKVANALIAGAVALGVTYSLMILPNINTSRLASILEPIIQNALAGTTISAITAKSYTISQKINLGLKTYNLFKEYDEKAVTAELERQKAELEKEQGGMSR